jgi:hypothetical protein
MPRALEAAFSISTVLLAQTQGQAQGQGTYNIHTRQQHLHCHRHMHRQGCSHNNPSPPTTAHTVHQLAQAAREQGRGTIQGDRPDLPSLLLRHVHDTQLRHRSYHGLKHARSLKLQPHGVCEDDNEERKESMHNNGRVSGRSLS